MSRLQKAVLVLFILIAVSNVVFMLTSDLHPDEAFCWVWSERLELGYFDHAPMVAYMVRLATTIGGDNEFWVRLPAFLIWIFYIGAIYYTARKIYRDRAAGLVGVLIALSAPMITIGGHLITPDLPMALFATLTWYFLYMAVEEEKRTAWYWAGLFFGLTLVSKYQGALIAPAVLCMLLIRPGKRKMLLWKEPYIAVLISLALFAPVLYWSWQHDWANFLYQFGKGIKTVVQLENIAEYLAGQIGAFSPLFLFLLGYTVSRLVKWRRMSSEDAYLIGGFLPIFGFFALTSLTSTALPNWPSAAYFPAVVFLAGQILHSFRRTGGWRRYALAGGVGLCIALGILTVSLARYPGFFTQRLGLKLPTEAFRANELEGWRELGNQVDAVLREHFPDGEMRPLFADTYMIAAELDFYVDAPKAVYTTREAHRDMYDYYLVDEIEELGNRGGLLILRGEPPDSAGLYFRGIEPVAVSAPIRYGATIRELSIFKFASMDTAALYEMALNKPLGYPGTYPD